MAIQEYVIYADIPAGGVDIGPPGASLIANIEAYNGTVPGPLITAEVGDTIIVRLINKLGVKAGIHWHGIELTNNADGTPVTQNGLAAAPAQTLGTGEVVGGTYLYKFDVTRAGIFWYHPHHAHSTNRVFRGLYGMIVVSDPAIETPLVGSVLPAAADTYQVVLSDMTVCATPGLMPSANPSENYPAPVGGEPEWLGSHPQGGPTPLTLCETSPMDEAGTVIMTPFGAGDIPTIQQATAGRTNEGNIVLANGRNPGGRAGTPDMPGALSGTNILHNVEPGQGIRLQLVNCAHARFFRLRLTDDAGAMIPLKRIGGEGGLLDQPILEGTDPMGGFNFQYDQGEILIPTAGRADVVAEIPPTASGTLTLWTRDFRRLGGGQFAGLPTMPVMHFAVGTNPVTPAYSLPLTTDLRAGGAPVATLGAATDAILAPAGFTPPKTGNPSATITLDAVPMTEAQIDGVKGHFEGAAPLYTGVPNLGSSRFAPADDIIQLQVFNNTNAAHPFHLHGFSFQPVTLELAGQPTYNFPNEFKDTQNIPSQGTLTFRIDTADRSLADGVSMGGVYGRWLFHCHIFFHAHTGMISELVVTNDDGTERPYVDVGGSWEYVPSGGMATRGGRFFQADGKPVTLTASDGVMSFPPGASSGSWAWSFDTTGEPDGVRYVYITADDGTRKSQTVFRLQIGGMDEGSDTGDPHLRSVDGTRFDFQSVGEFVLLRDTDGMEIQTRQTPVAAANPIQDDHSELRVCVSLNTAMAARVGGHVISYQPGREPGELVFYLNGKPTRLDDRGLFLGGDRVTRFDADGRMGIRIDYAHHPVVTVTPRFWNSHGVHYLNIDVAQTQADQGIMAPPAPGSWLPRLADGRNLGPRPASKQDRFVELYRTFANSWRVTNKTSMFVYAPGTSAETFADRDWPAKKPPCKVKPELAIPNAPALNGMPVEDAKKVCQIVTDPDLFQNCVFDVATTGDKNFAKGYRFQQDLRERSTAIQVVPEKPHHEFCDEFRVLAIVRALMPKGPTPKGSVTFYVDDKPAGKPMRLDKYGRAAFDARGVRPGMRVWAAYSGQRSKTGEFYRPSVSPSLIRPADTKVEDDDHPRQSAASS